MRLLLVAALVAGVLAPFPVSAETPAFDPRSWRGQHVGKPTEVLTIGSTHLGQMPKGVTITPDMLTPLIDKLAAFKPDIITHEGRSGEQCEQLRQYKARYPDMWSTYCFGTDDAEMATGLNVSQAMVVVEETLKTWPAQPTAAQRRKLASTFLAAGDRPSARVQWLQLPVAERKTGDGINAALLKILAREGLPLNKSMTWLHGWRRSLDFNVSMPWTIIPLIAFREWQARALDRLWKKSGRLRKFPKVMNLIRVKRH